MVVGHNQNSAVNVIGKEVRYDARFISREPALRHYILHKLWRRFVSVFKAKWAEPFDLGGGVGLKIEFLWFYGSKMGEMAGSSGERIDPDLETLHSGTKSFSGMEKSTLLLDNLKVDFAWHPNKPPENILLDVPNYIKILSILHHI